MCGRYLCIFISLIQLLRFVENYVLQEEHALAINSDKKNLHATTHKLKYSITSIYSVSYNSVSYNSVSYQCRGKEKIVLPTLKEKNENILC